MILLFEAGGITAITVLPTPPPAPCNPWWTTPWTAGFRIKQLVNGLNGFRMKLVTGLKGFFEMFMLVNGLRGFLNRVTPELLIGLIICDRLWGLILIKDAALGWPLIGLCRRIFWRSASQALLRSIKDVEAGRFKVFSSTWSKLNPVIKRFFNGLANSDELVDLIILQAGSGSSSGMFNKFFPTANNEFLCLVAGKELMASFERSSIKKWYFF